MTTRPAAALTLLWLAGCVGMNAGMSVTGPPEVRQPPVPAPFDAEGPPTLEPTDTPGLSSAPSLAPNLYYYEPDDAWYRYAYRRWYQAFRWNGNWFILDAAPEILVDRPIERRELPELP